MRKTIQLNNWQEELFREAVSKGTLDLKKIPLGRAVGKSFFFNYIREKINGGEIKVNGKINNLIIIDENAEKES